MFPYHQKCCAHWLAAGPPPRETRGKPTGAHFCAMPEVPLPNCRTHPSRHADASNQNASACFDRPYMNITADAFGPLAAPNMEKETAVRNTKDSHRSLTTKTITTSDQKDTGGDVPLSWGSDRGLVSTQLGLMPAAEKESRQRSLPHRLRTGRRPPNRRTAVWSGWSPLWQMPPYAFSIFSVWNRTTTTTTTRGEGRRGGSIASIPLVSARGGES